MLIVCLLVPMYCCSGGLSNLLYICSVADKVITKPSEPRKVMVRLFGQIIGTNPEVVIVDQVVFALLAEKGLVPKLYGIFTNGRVEEYVEVRLVVDVLGEERWLCTIVLVEMSTLLVSAPQSIEDCINLN
jgi:hypothetical protein